MTVQLAIGNRDVIITLTAMTPNSQQFNYVEEFHTVHISALKPTNMNWKILNSVHVTAVDITNVSTSTTKRKKTIYSRDFELFVVCVLTLKSYFYFDVNAIFMGAYR
jgi:hypothetical protein